MIAPNAAALPPCRIQTRAAGRACQEQTKHTDNGYARQHRILS
jgi:hypothetical protein